MGFNLLSDFLPFRPFLTQLSPPASNMEKTLKEEAVRVVSEMDSVLNELGGMFFIWNARWKRH